jgi:hypothetical protein
MRIRLVIRLRRPPAARGHPATASRDQQSPWLFSGLLPGQPIGYTTLRQQVSGLGLPLREARVSALGQLVVAAPAPVIADALGFHETTTTRQVAHAGGTWNQYPASRP